MKTIKMLPYRWKFVGLELLALSLLLFAVCFRVIAIPSKMGSTTHYFGQGWAEIVFPFSLQKLGKEVFSSCNLSIVRFEGQIPSGTNAFDGVRFSPSAFIKVQKMYKDDFVRTYPKLKGIVKTPLPKWLSWLE